jgi:hypothetical protein
MLLEASAVVLNDFLALYVGMLVGRQTKIFTIALLPTTSKSICFPFNDDRIEFIFAFRPGT